jgi:hypothetical protein
MLFIDRDRGLVEVEVSSDDTAAFIGGYHHAIRARLSGERQALRDFENKKLRIGGETYVPETDPQVLVSLYYGGELDYQGPYNVEFLGAENADEADVSE